MALVKGMLTVTFSCMQICITYMKNVCHLQGACEFVACEQQVAFELYCSLWSK